MTFPQTLQVLARASALATAVALALVGLSVIGASPAQAADDEIAFDSIPSTLAPNYVSYGLQAEGAREFGEALTLSRSGQLRSVSVLLSSWACETGGWTTGDCLTTDGATFDVPITVNAYALGAAGEPGALLGSATRTAAVPYRPSASPECPGGEWSADGGEVCSNGLAFSLDLPFDPGVAVPRDIVIGIAFPTTSIPAKSLNVALSYGGDLEPTVGAAGDVYVDSSRTGGYFCGGVRDSGIALGAFHSSPLWGEAGGDDCAPLGLTVALAAAVPATTVPVGPADVVMTRPTATSTGPWDGTFPGPCAAAPSEVAGEPWVFDIEDKPDAGTATLTADGLELAVTASPNSKARLLHYLASGSYGFDDREVTVAELLSRPLSWVQQELTSVHSYGPTFQIQAQRFDGSDCTRAILMNEWVVGRDGEESDLAAQSWFAISPVDPHLVNSASAVSSSQLIGEFGDWEVVAFGPNLGRDAQSYTFVIPTITALGTTFRFLADSPSTPVPPAPTLPSQEVAPPAPSAQGADGSPLAPPSVEDTETDPKAPGEAIEVEYADGTFQPYEWVQFVFYSVPAYSASLQANANGGLIGAVPVPTVVPAGGHTLAATGTSSGVVATAPVTVAAALAATGVDAAQLRTLGAIGLMTLLLGLATVALRVARRRSPRG